MATLALTRPKPKPNGAELTGFSLYLPSGQVRCLCCLLFGFCFYHLLWSVVPHGSCCSIVETWKLMMSNSNSNLTNLRVTLLILSTEQKWVLRIEYYAVHSSHFTTAQSLWVWCKMQFALKHLIWSLMWSAINVDNHSRFNMLVFLFFRNWYTL